MLGSRLTKSLRGINNLLIVSGCFDLFENSAHKGSCSLDVLPSLLMLRGVCVPGGRFLESTRSRKSPRILSGSSCGKLSRCELSGHPCPSFLCHIPSVALLRGIVERGAACPAWFLCVSMVVVVHVLTCLHLLTSVFWQDPTLIFLTVAAFISLAIGVFVEQRPFGWLEGVAILMAVVVVVTVGAVNDYQKEKQFRDLNAQKENITVSH